MHNELSNKVGIVTGGSSGIGFQISNVLAEAGATVYVISRTGQPKEGYGSSVPGVIHVKGDIGDAGSMTALLEEITAPNGGVLDFLVNNAGAITYGMPEEIQMPRRRLSYGSVRSDYGCQCEVCLSVERSVLSSSQEIRRARAHRQHYEHERAFGLFRGRPLLHQ